MFLLGTLVPVVMIIIMPINVCIIYIKEGRYEYDAYIMCMLYANVVVGCDRRRSRLSTPILSSPIYVRSVVSIVVAQGTAVAASQLRFQLEHVSAHRV